MRHVVKSGLSLLFALAVAAAPAAMARDHDRDHGHDRGHSSAQYRGNDHRDHGRDHGYRQPSSHYNRGYAYRPAPPRYSGRGYVSRPAYGRPHWVRGGRYYGNGYGPTYVVSDYYGYGLRAPPRGYYWRRSDLGDFLLVAATTGVIADLILHH